MEELIRLEAVERRYQIGNNFVYALRGIDLGIDRNEYVAIMGPSGSGKSTLMNIIGCLDTPDSGHYYFKGKDVGTLSDREASHIRNRDIGFVFQSFHLLPRLSALENVALPLVYKGIGKSIRLREAREMLGRVGLAERMEHFPGELSGGQKQRVALARALICRPSIILADEPTGNLDSATSAEIMGLIDDIQSEGTTVILVTHSQDIADHAKRIIRIEDGLVLANVMNN
ncbi:MAG: ABC transporter ATP-binding protein [Bacteroidales bacterium]|nr:ABC transporter ATP-binding protein [Bacteroidales bacterium]